MEREIKFRAWDLKRMTNSGIMFNTTSGELVVSEGSKMVLMQYTGLKDKNGKEIYEGDILDAIADDEYPEHTGISDVIFSHDLQNIIRSMGQTLNGNKYTCGLPITWSGWISLEVIGNIYENPELLKSLNS